MVQGFLWADELHPVAELDAAGKVAATFTYAEKGNVPSIMSKGGTDYRIISDHLGSVRMVVNNNSGAILQQLDYDPYGRVIVDTNPGFQPFGYAGGLYDRDTGLVRFGRRDYDPVVGRWTSKDPIGFAGGLNLYGYVVQDPVNLVDPRGEAACTYSISGQTLTRVPDVLAHAPVTIPVASGNNGSVLGPIVPPGTHCNNNPNCTHIPNRGPIPIGKWRWDMQAYPSRPNGHVLEPEIGTNIFERTLMRTHSCLNAFGPAIGPNLFCSKGCITGSKVDIKRLNRLLESESNSILTVVE